VVLVLAEKAIAGKKTNSRTSRWRENGGCRSARTGALEMEVEDGCYRGCWCVAGEVRRCGGGCHGGGRRKEN